MIFQASSRLEFQAFLFLSTIKATTMAAQVSEGVTKLILKPGSGERPKAGDQITVHCTGSLVSPERKFWRCEFPRLSACINCQKLILFVLLKSYISHVHVLTTAPKTPDKSLLVSTSDWGK